MPFTNCKQTALRQWPTTRLQHFWKIQITFPLFHTEYNKPFEFAGILLSEYIPRPDLSDKAEHKTQIIPT